MSLDLIHLPQTTPIAPAQTLAAVCSSAEQHMPWHQKRALPRQRDVTKPESVDCLETPRTTVSPVNVMTDEWLRETMINHKNMSTQWRHLPDWRGTAGEVSPWQLVALSSRFSLCNYILVAPTETNLLHVGQSTYFSCVHNKKKKIPVALDS